MNKNKKTQKILKQISELCESVKAENIKQYDMSGKSAITDYYVVCSGNSDPHIRAIKEKCVTQLRKLEITVNRVESSPQSRWVIIDLGIIILHIFHPQVRAYYDIEKLWEEGEDMKLNRPWTCPENEVLLHTLEDSLPNG